jgi:hypothetical protein
LPPLVAGEFVEEFLLCADSRDGELVEQRGGDLLDPSLEPNVFGLGVDP